MAYLVKRTAGDYKLNVHEEIKFVDIKNLNKYDFLPADIPIVEKLMRHNFYYNNGVNYMGNYKLLKGEKEGVAPVRIGSVN